MGEIKFAEGTSNQDPQSVASALAGAHGEVAHAILGVTWPPVPGSGGGGWVPPAGLGDLRPHRKRGGSRSPGFGL